MFTNHLKLALRNLFKNKTFSLINILGFAFGISICLGIATYLIHEYSFDRYHENAGRIYRLTEMQENSSSIDYRVKDILLANYPEIENACLFQMMQMQIGVTVNDRGYYVDNILSADEAFFDMFTVPVISGSPEFLLPDLNSVVLTQSAARKLFGGEDPLGKVIEVRNRFPLTVSAIIRDWPDNSSIQPQMIVNAENDNFKFSISMERGDDESTWRWPFRIYLLLHRDADKNALIEKVNVHADLLQPYGEQFGLLALTDMYLSDSTQGSQTAQGNAGLLTLLFSIGLTILILAVINYVNLTAAQQNRRYKEIGVKKTIGASRSNVLYQFLTESVLVTIISFGIGIWLLLESLPVYRTIFFDTFKVDLLLNYWYFILPAIILLGIITGIGSAYFFSSIHPIKALKGDVFTHRRKFSWRNGLTVFQFVVSIALIFCIFVMRQQIQYAKHNNAGFNDEQLLKVDAPQFQASDSTSVFQLINRFRQYSGISNVTMSNGVPGRINSYMGANMPGKDKFVSIIYADSSFLNTFGITIKEGRYPLPGDYGTTCLINEAAYNYFDWTDLEDKRYNNGRAGGFEVIGVVNDFHYSSLRNTIGPLAILLQKEVYPTNISLRLAGGNIGATMNFIRDTWNELLPQHPLHYEFYDSWLDAMYREDEKLGTAIGLFGALAIVISCMGILGMAIFTTQRRTKEIGVRKVVGASVQDILIMITSHFTKWVLIANIFAWPLAWYAMHVWLQDFAYRIELTVWPFIFSGLVAFSVALLAVSWQVIRAATANPTESLRYE